MVARSEAWVCIRILLLCLGLVCLGPLAAFPTPTLSFLICSTGANRTSSWLVGQEGMRVSTHLPPGTMWGPVQTGCLDS